MIKKVFIICSVCIMLGVGFTFMWQVAEEPKNTAIPEREVGKGYGSISGQSSDTGDTQDKENEKYLLVLENEKLCAYKIKGEDKTLLKSFLFSSTLIENSEVSKLTDGIYASSYEELCLYMESYIS